MKVYVIIITPEASPSRVHPQAYKTLREAQNAILTSSGYDRPKQRSEYRFRDNDYTDFLISEVEV